MLLRTSCEGFSLQDHLHQEFCKTVGKALINLLDSEIWLTIYLILVQVLYQEGSPGQPK